MKHYADRDIVAQGDFYIAHVDAMTREGLHSKSDIAAELAHRDAEIERLNRQLDTAADLALAKDTRLAALESQHRWRSEAEEKPTGKCVAFYVNECGKARTIMARYHKAKTVETSGEYDDVADYDEATDTYYLNEGWWEQVENGGDDITEWFVPDGANKITHWTPLPALPAADPEPTT